MKKELLIASALTASVGVAGVAQAASVSYSGNHRNGVAGSDLDSATADGTYGISQQTSLSFSVSETTDGGIKIATGFGLIDEGTAATANPSGLTLTFTDGSKLDVLKAGNAYKTHIASVPGGGGEVAPGPAALGQFAETRQVRMFLEDGSSTCPSLKGQRRPGAGSEWIWLRCSA